MCLASVPSIQQIYKSSKLLLQATVDLNCEEDLRMMSIQCRGARMAIQQLVQYFDLEAFDKLSKLEELAFQVLYTRQ